MKRILTALLLMTAIASAPCAFAQLRITVTSGATDPIPIAIVPFSRSVPGDGGLDVAQVVQRDLESSGRFKGMARTDMLNTPTSASEVDAMAWKQQHNDYVLVGKVNALPSGDLRVDAELVNVLTGQRVLGQNWTVQPKNLRNAAHRVADAVYEKVLGVRGAFATRIAYVSVDGKPPAQKYELYVADADGANRVRVLLSDRPIMSPAWSPDGEWLAYVSFEKRVS